MAHSNDVKNFMTAALSLYEPYIVASEKIIKPNPIAGYENFVYIDDPKPGEMNSYLKSHKEKWRIRFDASTKADIEGMTGALLDAVKKFNRRIFDVDLIDELATPITFESGLGDFTITRGSYNIVTFDDSSSVLELIGIDGSKVQGRSALIYSTGLTNEYIDIEFRVGHDGGANGCLVQITGTTGQTVDDIMVRFQIDGSTAYITGRLDDLSNIRNETVFSDAVGNKLYKIKIRINLENKRFQTFVDDVLIVDWVKFYNIHRPTPNDSEVKCFHFRNQFVVDVDSYIDYIYTTEPYIYPIGLVNLKLNNLTQGDLMWHNRFHRVLELEMEWWA